MNARFVADFAAVRARYAKESGPICEAIEALGNHLDVSRLSAEALRKRIWKLPEESVCLVGGYTLLPTFVRDNPTGPSVPGYEKYGDTDAQIPTDGAYGADPKDPAGELIPAKAISRIPDGAPADAASFLKTLRWQAQALALETLPGSFEEASDDLARPARALSGILRKLGGSGKVALSPRDGDIGARDLTARISNRGRIHLLLHGSNRSPQWSTLFGRIPHANPVDDTRALSAPLLDLCDLRGAMVVLTSCYGAMLDDGVHADRAARSPADQVALAALAHGAKALFGATRSNWIDLQGDQSNGPGLTAHLWRRLGENMGAAESLRRAKHDLHDEIVHGERADVGFGVKTLLQAHCYGHPLAALPKRGRS